MFCKDFAVSVSFGLALIAAPAGNVWGQQRSGEGVPPSSGSSMGRLSQQTVEPYPGAQPSLYLTGRVVLDDGGAPPDTAVIETICGAQPHIQAYTDRKGRFSFQFGDRGNAALQDASVGGFDAGIGPPPAVSTSNSAAGLANLVERSLAICEVRARLPGYESEVVSLANHRTMDNPDVGTVILHRIAPVEGRVISLTTLAAPKKASQAFEKGLKAIAKGKSAEAIRQFQKAVQLDSGFAAAWCELGKAQTGEKEFDAARASFEAALKADPKYIEPYLYLAALQVGARQWPQVIETTERAIRLDPFDCPQAYFFNAMGNYNLRNVAAAEKAAREAQRIDKLHLCPKASALLGIILSERGDYAGASEQLRQYLKYSPKAGDAARVRATLADWDRLARK